MRQCAYDNVDCLNNIGSVRGNAITRPNCFSRVVMNGYLLLVVSRYGTRSVISEYSPTRLITTLPFYTHVCPTCIMSLLVCALVHSYYRLMPIQIDNPCWYQDTLKGICTLQLSTAERISGTSWISFDVLCSIDTAAFKGDGDFP